jgi:hypothetical protein
VSTIFVYTNANAANVKLMADAVSDIFFHRGIAKNFS